MTTDVIEFQIENIQPKQLVSHPLEKRKCVVCGNWRTDYSNDFKTCDRCRSSAAKFYTENKDKYTQQVLCECGCLVKKYCLNGHKKTKKHIQLLNMINSIRSENLIFV